MRAIVLHSVLGYKYMSIPATCTIFIPITAHAPISTHPSNSEIISHKLVNHILISISQGGVWTCIYGVFGFDSCKNIEMNRSPPLMTLLSALGAYWNGTGIDSYPKLCGFNYCMI